MHRIPRLELANVEFEASQHVVRYRAFELRAGPGRHLRGIIIPWWFGLSGPGCSDRCCRVSAQQLACRLRFGAPFVQRPVKLDELDCQTPHVVAYFVERGLYRAGQQPKNQSHESHQHREYELDKLGRLSAPVLFRKDWADQQTKRAAAK